MAFWEVAVPNTGPFQTPGCGRQDAGFAGAGRAGYHLDGAGEVSDVPDGGGLVHAQPARRGTLTRVVRTAAQLRVEQRGVCAQAPRGQLTGQPRRALRLRMRDQLFFRVSCAVVAYRTTPGRE